MVEELAGRIGWLALQQEYPGSPTGSSGRPYAPGRRRADTVAGVDALRLLRPTRARSDRSASAGEAGGIDGARAPDPSLSIVSIHTEDTVVDDLATVGETGTPVVDGIVLSAGRSSRMGQPKPLLWIEGETFVEHAVRTLEGGGCREVVVVVNGETDRVPALAAAAGARYVVNEDLGSEQAESLRIGLEALEADCDAAAVLPVDQPLVSETTVAALVRAFGERAARVVRPVHDGEPGHPVLIARTIFAEFCAAELPRGAETVVERHSPNDVPVSDPGAVIDIDTPEQYRRHVGMP